MNNITHFIAHGKTQQRECHHMNRIHLPRGIYLTIAVIALALCLSPAVECARFSDLSGHWAQKQIEDLASRGIIGGYPGGKFRPDDPITRAELAEMAGHAFNLKPDSETTFTDTEDHWARSYIGALAAREAISPYPDNTFRPDKAVTRAELVTALVKLSGLGETRLLITNEAQSPFTDLDRSYWAYDSIVTAQELGLLSPAFTGRFWPEKAASRAEAASIIHGAFDLNVRSAEVKGIDQRLGSIQITSSDGSPAFIHLGPGVALYRNNVPTSLDQIMAGDEIYIISNNNDQPQLVKAFGVVTKDDVMARIGGVAQRLLNEADLRALLTGDWEQVQQDIMVSLYDRLLTTGLTPAGAQAIMARDWAVLNEISQVEIITGLTKQYQVPEPMAMALLEKDWDSLRSYAENELLRTIINNMVN